MSRYTSELAARKVDGIYDLVLIASVRAHEIVRERTKEYIKGGFSIVPVKYKNGPIITALTEVEHGLVGRDYLQKVK